MGVLFLSFHVESVKFKKYNDLVSVVVISTKLSYCFEKGIVHA